MTLVGGGLAVGQSMSVPAASSTRTTGTRRATMHPGGRHTPPRLNRDGAPSSGSSGSCRSVKLLPYRVPALDQGCSNGVRADGQTGIVCAMTTHPRPGPSLVTGPRDVELNEHLTAELVAFNAAATGSADRDMFSVKVSDDTGELIGGLAAWTWGGLCGIEMLWVRESDRKEGWGSRMLEAAEAEARRRGCDRMTVSSFTFQAPAFYQQHGYVETGRTLGIPGGHADVHMFKTLTSRDG